jgi:outer membrane immunogenic protein
MKRVILAGVFTVAAAGLALAADLPQPAPPPPQAPAAYVPVVAPVYNWSGIYVGINGGWGIGTADWTPVGGTRNSVSANGGVIGGTLGFNYQMGAFEGDFDWSAINSSTASTACAVSANCQSGNTWLSTLRGRAGFAVDRVLFYGTAGGAFANEQITANGVTDTQTQAGWTAGAGVEAAFADNWTAKIEYLYVDLGTATCNICGGTTVSITDNLVRGGVNFKFNF